MITHTQSSRPRPKGIEGARLIIPGLTLCLIVTFVAYLCEAIERALFGEVWLEALVLAILIGTMMRSFWTPGIQWRSGISFSAKYILEIAVVLLGASISAATIMAAGSGLLIGIAVTVAASILLAFGIGRILGLPTRMAILIACGNSICGNSAIAAIAPVIGADSEDVAASIAFTAVLGVAVVLGLPILGVALGMSNNAFGALAGLTVYAVPQVIAAASPFGPAAVQMGTLVKLVRVLMLGPVCLIFAILTPQIAKRQKGLPTMAGESSRLVHLVPWFIIGFIGFVICRSLGFIPTLALKPINHVATVLTVVSMAALGLGVDVRTVARAGTRATVAVVLSLLSLGLIGLGLMWTLHLA